LIPGQEGSEVSEACRMIAERVITSVFDRKRDKTHEFHAIGAIEGLLRGVHGGECGDRFPV